ncbi:hypothetical protein G647_07850 [Cladophialophora carrionii CBS 160.54]|uniref:Zn(2)-C6 fungal-type domain-containing protein n=1 Tax=Cladophialophora carrionii CBS 160.54 TaxID=1279043 RepID=V9D5D8_9EURO|nr:uncharacterized protein G647_07850 [Cladophialophora carrionii CBS 160.54]ETI21503.1 hypothetical protein G647_07850 [Cladophialophora carrionii CBS 160.54]
MGSEESSPPSNSLATKDCRVCNRRRIRCDRTLPFCNKCARKGVECPGFGPKFRWTNAIAVRGRFKGRGAPIVSPHVRVREEEPSSLRRAGEEDTPSPSYQLGLALAQQLSPSTAKHLLQYYADNIAPLMVWLDSDQNEYKRLVIPLAEKDTVLRLAVLAISAAHMPDGDGLAPGFSHATGEAAIHMITERVRHVTQRNLEDPETDVGGGIAAEILAAMLILSNHCLLQSASAQAHFHRRAARILIRSLELKQPSGDELTFFLKNQMAIYDVLACTTLFNYDHIQHAILPSMERQDVLFGDFLHLLHRVTLMSLDKSKPARPPENLEEEFELSSGSTLVASGPLAQTLTRSARQDFIRLVLAYQYAGMLFACKRLSMSLENGQIVDVYTNKLFRVFDQFEDISASLHNLAWPLLIAGICCCGDEQRMNIISSFCQRLSANTRFEHYAELLTFLQELWQSGHSDWTLLAREWERKGTPVIAV